MLKDLSICKHNKIFFYNVNKIIVKLIFRYIIKSSIISKLILLVYIIFLTLVLTLILNIDSNIVIYIDNYEIFTNTKIIFLVCFAIFLSGFLINYIIDIFILSKKNRSFNNLNNKYIKYLNNIYNSIFFGISGDEKKSSIFLNRAQKNIDNKLTELVSVFIKNDNKKINNGLFNYNIDLSKAIQDNDVDKIVVCCKKILKIQKNNQYCIDLLYNTYKNTSNWVECYNFAELYKIKITKKELNFLYKKLSIYYYNIKDYNNSSKYSILLFNDIKDDIENNKILSDSLYKIKSKKLNNYIEKIWKYTPNEFFGNIYCDKDYRMAKKLYNINKNNIHSILFYCNTFIANGNKVDNIILDKIKDFDKDRYLYLFKKNQNID